MAEPPTTTPTLPPQAAALGQALGSIGFDVSTENRLRVASILFLRQMNGLFGDGGRVDNFDPAMTTKLQATINEALFSKDDDGVTGLEKFKAIAAKDIDFLVKDMNFAKTALARSTLEDIYSNNDLAHAIPKVLEESSDDKIKALAGALKTYAPEMLQRPQESLALLQNYKDVFANMGALAQGGFFNTLVNPADLNQNDPRMQLAAAIQSVEAMIGMPSPDGQWGAEEQQKLKDTLRQLQNDPILGAGLKDEEKDGIYSAKYREKLETLAPQLPESTPEQQEFKGRLLTLVDGLAQMDARGVAVLSDYDALDTGTAAQRIETALIGLVPKINETLDKNQDNVLVKSIVEIFAGDLMDQRIPTNITLDGRLDFNDQAALQGLIMVLSNPAVLSDGKSLPKPLPKALGEPWEYTAAKGDYILKRLTDPENPPAFLLLMEEKERKAFQDLVKSGQLDALFTALDYMNDRDQLASYALFHGQGQAFAPLTRDILADDVARLNAAGHLDAVQLHDALLRAYTGGFGLNDVLDKEHQIPDTSAESVHLKERLAIFYKKAREQFAKDQGTYDGFEAFLLPSLQTLNLLPFGDEAQRTAFREGVLKSARAAGSDGDKFAQGVEDAINGIEGEIGYTHNYEIQPMLHPKLESMTPITSGGKAYSADDIIDMYNDHQIAYASPNYRAQAKAIPLCMQSYMAFRDDHNDVYVAVIDKKSMVFSVEKIDMDLMGRYLEPEEYLAAHKGSLGAEEIQTLEHLIAVKAELAQKYDAREASAKYVYEHAAPALREKSAGFAMLFPEDMRWASGSTPLAFLDHMKSVQNPADSSSALDAMAHETMAVAKAVRANAANKVESPKTIPIGGNLYEAQLAGEFEAVAYDSIASRDDANRLLRDADDMAGEPQMLDQEHLSFLLKYAGKNLALGKALGMSIRVAGVDVQPGVEPDNAMAYYNRLSQKIVIMPRPDYFDKGNVDARRELARGIYIEGVDPEAVTPEMREQAFMDYYKRLKNDYPELYEMAVLFSGDRDLELRLRRAGEHPSASDIRLLEVVATGLSEEVAARYHDPRPKMRGWDTADKMKKQWDEVHGQKNEPKRGSWLQRTFGGSRDNEPKTGAPDANSAQADCDPGGELASTGLCRNPKTWPPSSSFGAKQP
ncbi:MAG: hypothetical protein KDI46_07885 [Alphaproteobacteria bacterium]|nr:hypothetical protein [Alphaproteobacteria bacterium]